MQYTSTTDEKRMSFSTNRGLPSSGLLNWNYCQPLDGRLLKRHPFFIRDMGQSHLEIQVDPSAWIIGFVVLCRPSVYESSSRCRMSGRWAGVDWLLTLSVCTSFIRLGFVYSALFLPFPVWAVLKPIELAEQLVKNVDHHWSKSSHFLTKNIQGDVPTCSLESELQL